MPVLAEKVQAQPEDAALSMETDGTWTVAPGSTAGYRVDEVLNGVDDTVAGTTDEVNGSVVVQSGALTSAEVVVDVSGSIPVTFADHGIEPPSLGVVRVEDAGSVEFLRHLAR